MELREEQNTVKPDFRVIIAGGRDFNDYPLLKAKCDKILASKSQTHNIVVITGAARGADSLGEQYARENGYAIDSRPADWNAHGKSAGFIRNVQMANSADALIAFWDGKSHGTKHMIDTAINKGLETRTIIYRDMNKEELKQHLSDIDYVIDEDTNAVIIDADEIDVDELCRLGKSMGGQLSTTKNGRIMFTFSSSQEGHKFGATMVELARARALGNKESEKDILARIYPPVPKEAKIDRLKEQTAQYAIEHITGKGHHTGIAWLRDSFNELCEAMGIPTPQAPENYESEDVINALKEEPWVKDIAAKPADQRTTEDIDRIVNDFYCEHWLMKSEEVTSKDVAQLMDFADPLSHRHLVGQKVAIDCIHALNHEQLQQLDKVLDDIVQDPSENKELTRKFL